jgi:hypothetical protein
MSRPRRAALIAIAACAAPLALGPGPAWADGETVVTYTGSPGLSAEISVQAAAAKSNGQVFESLSNLLGIRDSAGVTESSPYCNQPSPTEVHCMAEGLQRLEVNSGDGADTVNFRDFCITITIDLAMGTGNDSARASGMCLDGSDTHRYSGGPGRDRVTADVFVEVDSSPGPVSRRVVAAGGGGNDRLSLAGPATAIGEGASDTLIGGRGPQRLFGGRGNDTINCGKGRDVANGGPGKNFGGAGCERVVDVIERDQG